MEYNPFHESGGMREERYYQDSRRQGGISFPHPGKQQHLLIIRANLYPEASLESVRAGLISVCTLIEDIYEGGLLIDEVQQDGSIESSRLTKFDLTATIGFGATFFEKLDIPKWNRPANLSIMPSHLELGDLNPYSLKQTDLLLQLASSNDFVNRSIYEYSYDTILQSDNQHTFKDIRSAIKGWAQVTDLHVGFQRLDRRNLMGFYDGISNPRGPELEDIVWLNDKDEGEKFVNGTYMVFQRIEHDLEYWRSLPTEQQELMIGHSKETGLVLGTVSKDKDHELATNLRSGDAAIRTAAINELKDLLSPQRDPKTKLFDPSNPKTLGIIDSCPIWSHARKANPRQADGTPFRSIYRRGYLFSDIAGPMLNSGLLFICFQKNIHDGFEHIKKNWMNNKDFPVPQARSLFTEEELMRRRYRGRFTPDELKFLSQDQKNALGLDWYQYEKALTEAQDPDTQNTGKEGLSGPSKLGVYPRRNVLASVTLGGGYYFIPPVPNDGYSFIGQLFFE
jgi:Dyp-type peroxidase family